MSQDKLQNTNTTDSIEIMEGGIRFRLLANRIRKVLSAAFFFLISVFLILFFTLPAFQTKGMNMEGLVNFSREDILSLSATDAYMPNLFFKTAEAKENLLTNSKGFVLKADFSNDGILSACTILEDYPVCRFSNVTYFSSGITLEEGLDNVDSLCLGEERKSELKEKMTFNADSLPLLHFPKGIEADDDNRAKAISTLIGVCKESLKYISGIQFENESEDSNWSNIATLLVKNENRYYLIKGIQTYHFNDYVSQPYFSKLLFDNFDAAIDKGKVNSKNFSFFGEEHDYSVYEFKALYNDSEKKVTYVY